MINFEQQRSGLRRRIVGKAASIIPMSFVPAQLLFRLDREVFRLSRGRTTFSAWVSGLPIVMLTTTGARTGQPRTVPVLGLPDGERLVVIASNFGQLRHPGWYHNLSARPYAVVTWNGSAAEMHARELTGEQRERYLTRSHEAYPWWEQYHRRAAPRQIPLIMLEPLVA